MNSSRVRLALFCGGRGSSAILRALLERPDVDITLLVNAYDDGRSTGMLRMLLGDLPGPADFRKNLAVLLEEREPALSRLLEARLEQDAGRREVSAQIAKSSRGDVGDALQLYAEALFDELDNRGKSLDADDCAIGNILLAGAFLRNGRDFNRALGEVASLLEVPARIVNVDDGASRHLVALKGDGEILCDEASIVAAQSPAPIADLYLLERPLAKGDARALEPESLSSKRATLSSMHVGAQASEAAISALESADVIVYGPGTQFSSLLPSYLVRGIAEAIDRSAAEVRAQLINVRYDHDIRGRHALEIVELALRFLGDETNARRRITHALVDGRGREPNGSDRVRLEENAEMRARDLGIELVVGDFESPTSPSKHEGRRVVHAIMRAMESARFCG